MSIGRLNSLIGISLILVFAIGDAGAQRTVYKWTDEDGVVHFGDAPPDGVEAQSITTAAPPPAPPPRQVATPGDQEAEATATPQQAEQEEAAVPIAAPKTAADMTLAELDERCESAREAKIAPLREAEIESCKADRRNDPAFCDSHNADFGEGGRTITGAMRPRMFDDLPECVEALQERNRRSN